MLQLEPLRYSCASVDATEKWTELVSAAAPGFHFVDVEEISTSFMVEEIDVSVETPPVRLLDVPPISDDSLFTHLRFAVFGDEVDRIDLRSFDSTCHNIDALAALLKKNPYEDSNYQVLRLSQFRSP